MERLRRRPDPAAIDITWVSCRGVRSSLPFHTPCLYATIFVTTSSGKGVHGHRRPHRVTTHTDRAGGGNPEWDAPLRLYLPEASSSPPAPEMEPGESKKDRGNCEGGSDDVQLVRFEIKAEVAVLGDVLAASAAVSVPDLVADGRTRRLSYQLAGPDGRQPNGVISFSYTFHGSSSNDDSGDAALHHPATPLCTIPNASSAVVALPPPSIAAAPRLYPVIEWPLTEQTPAVYPPLTTGPLAVADTPQHYPPPPPANPVEEPAAVYPPLPETSFCGLYPTAVDPASALYPTVDLGPVSCYPPAPPSATGCGYAAAPEWGDRCFYG